VNGWIVLAAVTLVVVLLAGFYLSMTAGRLDHLHRRIDMSRLALEAQLLRRSSVAIELASSGVLDPATSIVVAEAAHEARTATDGSDVDRALAESDLTAALVAAMDADDVAEVAASAGARRCSPNSMPRAGACSCRDASSTTPSGPAGS